MKGLNKEILLLVIILLIASALRIWGISYDLPYIYHPDEPLNIATSQQIFRTGDLDPHRFDYPSLLFYLNALAYVPYYLYGKLIGTFHSPVDILPPVSLAMGVTLSPIRSTVLLGRFVTVFFSVATVALTFAIGKQLGLKTAGAALASLMAALSPANVSFGRFVTPDTLVTCFAAASFLAILLVYQQGQIWQYVTAGVCIGLAASSKYNGGLMVLPLVVAHFLRYGRAGLKQPRIYLALLLSGLAFLATTPFALIDFHAFLDGLTFDISSYSTSTAHEGMQGNALGFYLSYAWRTTGVLCLLAVLEILRGIYVRSKQLILLSSYPLAHFVLLSSLTVRNGRNFLPLTPFLFLLAASFLVALLGKAEVIQPGRLRQWATLAIGCLSIGSLAFSTSKTITDTIQLTTVDSRTTARVWIANNLPPGTKIAIEQYSPYIDPKRFSIQAVAAIPTYSPNWYIARHVQYLVFSEGMYGRYYREPDLYQAWIKRYDGFFKRFPLVKIFNDGGYEIRIYKVQ